MSQRTHHISSITSSSESDENYLLQLLGQYQSEIYFKQNTDYAITLNTKEQVSVSLGFNLAKRKKKNPKAVDFACEVTGQTLGAGGQGEVYSSEGMVTICKKNGKPSLYVKLNNKRIVKVANNLGLFTVNSKIQRHDLEQEYEMMASLHEIYRPKPPEKNASIITLVSARFEGCPLHKIHLSSVEKILAIFINLLSELQKLERKGVTHRDVKYDNILVADDLSVKIIDLGYAVNTNKTPLDDKSQCPGTEELASPEITGRNYRAIGSRSDIFNIGRMLLFIFSNSLDQYKSKSVDQMLLLDVIYQSTSGWLNKASPYEKFEDDLKKLLTGMLALDPAKRFSSRKSLEALEMMQSKINNGRLVKSFGNVFNHLSRYNILQIMMLLAFGFLVAHMSKENHHSTDCSMNMILISMGIELLSVLSTYFDLNSTLKTAVNNRVNPCKTVLEAGSVQMHDVNNERHYVSHRAPGF